VVILILERVTPALRGELTRWLIQPKTGVFVGQVSARVRDLLWQRAATGLGDGAGLMIHSDNTEQGFSIKSAGDTSKIMADFEGLTLPKTPKPL
jgi:CRISPR-associated protein Cas2